MNREILYRGQLRRKGEKVRLDGTPFESKWVYGGVCQFNDYSSIIYQTEPEFRKYPVYTDTVEQYTGLTDRNGVKIFEGDIIEYQGKRYSINYLKHYARFSAVKPNTVFCVFAYQMGEVIGNIHDNPELLKGEENDSRRCNENKK